MTAAAVPGPAAREVLAVRYGQRTATRSQCFLNFHRYGEPDADLPLDYYFWVIRDATGIILVDTGFDLPVGRRRGRTGDASPAQVLPELGISPGDVTAVVVTHAHWDHIGNVRQFPRAELVMTEAEYDFWTSPMGGRGHFAAEAEAGEIALLRERRARGALTLFTGQMTLAPGLELIELGGHTPGQLIAAVATPAGGTAVLASDALHFYEEVERDRPFAIVADLPAMYEAYDTLAQLSRQPATHLVAGHDPEVRARFAPYREPSAGAGIELTDLTRPRPLSAGGAIVLPRETRPRTVTVMPFARTDPAMAPRA